MSAKRSDAGHDGGVGLLTWYFQERKRIFIDMERDLGMVSKKKPIHDRFKCLAEGVGSKTAMILEHVVLGRKNANMKAKMAVLVFCLVELKKLSR